MKIYRLADLGLVWVQAQIYEQDLRLHQAGPGGDGHALLPARPRVPRARDLHLSERGRERPARRGCGWSSTIPATSSSPACSPPSRSPPNWSLRRCWCRTWRSCAAARRTPSSWRWRAASLSPRTVTLGPQAENDMYQVLSGLKEGERIVTSGQFMLDSESQLREAIQKMLEPREPSVGACERRSAASAPARNQRSMPPRRSSRMNRRQIHLPDAGTRLHRIRPSRQVPHLRHDAGAGVRRQTLHKLQPGGKLLYYTCPMPEHSDVHSRQTGQVPQVRHDADPGDERPDAAAVRSVGIVGSVLSVLSVLSVRA